MSKITLHYGTQKSTVKSVKMTVFTGFVEIRKDKKYLYRQYSGITRLTKDDALQDAANILPIDSAR